MTHARDTVIGVLGAGTMGSGIAQVAAAAGHAVVLADTRQEALDRARKELVKSLVREVEKQRLTAQAAADIESRVYFSTASEGIAALPGCGLVIEAIVEDLAIKRESFRRIEPVVGDAALLATNTSSLSVTAIAAACTHPERVLGIHFFNPAPVMPLVEVVPGLATSRETMAAARGLLGGWGKTTVEASDTPGFIVNRIARPFYGEALRIYEEGIADRPTIDWAMRAAGGFRMGPFELMDLIGNDVNLAVTQAIFEAFGYDSRYRPSVTQRRLVEAGLLGKKTGRGHYDYRPGAGNPEPTQDRDLADAIVPRILALLINAAVDALFWRVASRDDIDLAMT